MNAGMFGHPGGIAGAGSRQIISLGSQIEAISSSSATTLNLRPVARAVRVASASVPTSVRTRLHASIGKGACRFFAIDHDAASAQTVTIDVVLDGVTVSTKSVSIPTSGAGSVLVIGFFTPSTTLMFSPDYVPFNTSFEVYVTQSGSTTFNYIYTVDGHQ